MGVQTLTPAHVCSCVPGGPYGVCSHSHPSMWDRVPQGPSPGSPGLPGWHVPISQPCNKEPFSHCWAGGTE